MKATGLGDNNSKLKTRLWQWRLKEAIPPHWSAGRRLTAHSGAITLLPKRARTIGVFTPCCDHDDDDGDDDTSHKAGECVTDVLYTF